MYYTMRTFLRRVRAHVFGENRRRARSLPNVRDSYIFVHIPKNAGSSVAEAIDMEMSWHYTAQAYRQMLGWPEYHWRYSFGFVRNPWDRFLSLYRYARLKESQYHSAIDPDSAPHGKHDDYDLLVDASVEDCARYLHEGRLKHDDFINHWRPQSDWLIDEDGRIIVDFVGNVETINRDFRCVAYQCDLTASTLPVTNTSRASMKGGASEKEPGKIDRDYRSSFTKKARDLVAEYYREDIERFGYDF